MILTGDVGGTKTTLALFEEAGGRLRLVREDTRPSQETAGLEAIVQAFLDAAGRPRVRAACFGLPGAVVDGRVKATNLPWTVEEARLATALGVSRVRLLNDLEAAAHGVLALEPDGVETLQAGSPPAGGATMALIAAGTGLGQAILAWDGRGHRVLPSEGGHVDFAPRSDVEAALWAALRREFGRVSYERVVSGPGLLNVYRFLRGYRGGAEPVWLTAELARDDPGAVISRSGLADTDPVCTEALGLFVSVYGAAAGNLALTALATGGVYVGGGIAPKILPALRTGRFVEAFTEKGRLTPLLQATPVHVVLDPRAPLRGAAACARAL